MDSADIAAAPADTAELAVALGYIAAWITEQNHTDRSAWFATILTEAAEALSGPENPQEPPQVTTPAQCGKRDTRSRTAAPCDRPAAHTGDCSWQAARRLRMLQEYQDSAAEARRLGTINDRLTRENTRLARDLAYLTHHTRPWWQRIFGRNGPTP